jgi:hypothetical protein
MVESFYPYSDVMVVSLGSPTQGKAASGVRDRKTGEEGASVPPPLAGEDFHPPFPSLPYCSLIQRNASLQTSAAASKSSLPRLPADFHCPCPSW